MMLRHAATGDLYPYNEALASRPDMLPVEPPAEAPAMVSPGSEHEAETAPKVRGRSKKAGQPMTADEVDSDTLLDGLGF